MWAQFDCVSIVVLMLFDVTTGKYDTFTDVFCKGNLVSACKHTGLTKGEDSNTTSDVSDEHTVK